MKLNLKGSFDFKALLFVMLTSCLSSSNAAPFTPSANGQEVTDIQTGLIWRRCAEGMSWNGATCIGLAITLKHEDALIHANAQAQTTGVAWRMPNVRELSSIVGAYPNVADLSAFPATPMNWFWSSSPYLTNNFGNLQGSRAWLVHFGDGGTSGYLRFNTVHVRLVR